MKPKKESYRSHVSQATLDARKQRKANHARVASQPGSNPEGTKMPKGEEFAVKTPGAIKVRRASPASLDGRNHAK